MKASCAAGLTKIPVRRLAKPGFDVGDDDDRPFRGQSDRDRPADSSRHPVTTAILPSNRLHVVVMRSFPSPPGPSRVRGRRGQRYLQRR